MKYNTLLDKFNKNTIFSIFKARILIMVNHIIIMTLFEVFYLNIAYYYEDENHFYIDSIIKIFLFFLPLTTY